MSAILLLSLALAQAEPAPAAPPTPTAEMPAPETLTQKDKAYLLGKQLRCPVCQGMSIAESPSSMAQDMMKRVRSMVAEGQSDEQIYTYFIDRYGEWVLLAPPAHGFSLWVWALPPLFVLGAAGMLVRWVRRLRAGAKGGGEKPQGSSPEVEAQTPAAAGDAYLQAIRDEVQR